jgi:DNA-binding transcriptional LysR family regulator
VRGKALAPRGTLTVTAPVMFGRLHILPIVTELIQRHPGLNVRLLLLDRVVRLVEEGVDVAVRIADLPDSALHMRKVGEVRRVLSASPAYLREKGEPREWPICAITSRSSSRMRPARIASGKPSMAAPDGRWRGCRSTAFRPESRRRFRGWGSWAACPIRSPSISRPGGCNRC